MTGVGEIVSLLLVKFTLPTAPTPPFVTVTVSLDLFRLMFELLYIPQPLILTLMLLALKLMPLVGPVPVDSMQSPPPAAL